MFFSFSLLELGEKSHQMGEQLKFEMEVGIEPADGR
jgi:hypothetical protein